MLRALSMAAVALLAACGGSSPTDPASTPAPSTPAPSTPAPTTPAFTPSARAIEAKSADGTYIARWEPEGGALPDAEPFNMRFALRRADGAPIAATATFAVDAEMPHHGHGMNLVPTVTRAGSANGDELIVASGMLLHMPGRWVLSLDVGEGGIVERTQWFIDVQ